MSNIHASAIISPRAQIGQGVDIGAFTIVHDNVELGDGTSIGSHCELGVQNALSGGELLRIGRGSTVRSHSVFYEGSSFGEGLVTGHRVTVREMTTAGKDLQIGTLGDIQGHCTIGDHVRTHSSVHIGQTSKVGNFVWIFPYVVLTNDPHPPSDVKRGVVIADFAVVATMTVVLPGVHVGEGGLIGACSLVNRDTLPNKVYSGSPAVEICDASDIKMKDGTDRPAYPWTTHFHRGYPEDIVKSWIDAVPAEVRRAGRQ